ncbi:MAG: Fibronectin type III protein [uncultured bacterium (gcode 4)]|uniref:Fibronectin type III protein n=1 Tax=uncultured bacterium (gcode 4) TaxID=1234023 RepID=K2G0K5_9BACT|nr:MAG: Fibronectin type III protein [uncultured bacterium (gcode 4)]
MKNNNTRKITSVITIVTMLFSFFWPWIGLMNVNAALTPWWAVWIVNPVTWFPDWYQDQNWLKLELMEAADNFSISDPVDPSNTFSETIWFNAEWFWWSAEAEIVQWWTEALLVLAMEAVFAGEEAVDGEQSAFGRLRIRIDWLDPNTEYTVRHPYWTDTFTSDGVGVINEPGSDIWCFSTPNVTTCDPAKVGTGNPPLVGVGGFWLALSSQIWPFLTWDDFNIDPALTANDLKNLQIGYTTRTYIWNPNIPHTITWSPVNQNFFRIEGPNAWGLGVNEIEQTLFAVSWRLFAPIVQLNSVSYATWALVNSTWALTYNFTVNDTWTASFTWAANCTDIPSFNIGVAWVNTGQINLSTDWSQDWTYSSCSFLVTNAEWNGSNIVQLPSFTLDTTPPVAPTITTQNFSTSGSLLELSWTWESNTLVEILSWATVMATWSNVAWSFTISWIPVFEGSNDFVARLTDWAGNVSTDSTPPLTVIVDTVAPDAPVITDATWTLVNTPSITINGTAEANSNVKILRWTWVIATWVSDWLWVFAVNSVPLVEWLNTLFAVSSDAAWNISVWSVDFTITLDSTDPVWTLTFPAWSVTNISTWTINLTINEVWTFDLSWAWMVWTLSWAIETSTWMEVTFSIWDWQKAVIALFTDAAWNTSSVTWSINLDTTAPVSPTITSTDITTSWATVTITWTWEANASVEILNWSWIVIASWNVDWAWSFAVPWVPVLAWTNSIQARLIDEIWNVWNNSSQTVTVTVDTIMPDAPVISVSANLTSSWTIEITGTWEANASFTIYKWAVALWNWAVDWSWVISIWAITLTEWSNSITAKLTDEAWNTSASSNTINVTKDSIAPVISNRSIVSIEQLWAILNFDFTDSHYTLGTWTWVVTVWTWWSLNNAWSFGIIVSTWSVNQASTIFSGLLPSTTYWFNISLLDDVWNSSASTGSFVTASVPNTSTWAISETWSTSLTWSISNGWTYALDSPFILINSNPNDLNSIDWSLTLSWITNINVSGWTWNWVINPPSLINSGASEEAAVWELTTLLNSNFWSWVTWNILQTIKAWWENNVTLAASWWTFELSVLVPGSSSWSILNLFRSADWSTWELNVPDASCIIDSNSFCTFRTDHLSFFATIEVTDNIPDVLSFASLTWRELWATETSETRTIVWMNTWALVTVTNWTISIDGWTFASAWNIFSWSTVQLRVVNSSSSSSASTASMIVAWNTIWSFTSTTKAAASNWGSSGGGGGGWAFVDICTNWDKSWNSYDWKCEAPAILIWSTSSNSWVSNTAAATGSYSGKPKFGDINDSFAKDDILDFVAKWILKWFDDGTFRPENPITRAEFLAIVMKALDVKLNESLTESSFTDIPASWMIKYVEKAKEYWIKGQVLDGKLKFRPNDSISRAEAMAILMNIAWITVSANITNSSFTDIPASWMISYLEKAKELGIAWWQMIEWKLKFRPNDSLSRAEATRILSKTLGIKNMKIYSIELSASWSSQTITINKGDKVNFINKDSVPHWPASGMHPIHTWYPGSGIEKCWTPEQSKIFDACKWLAKDEVFSFIFNEVWEWGFHDHLNVANAALRGKIIVK